GRGPTADPRFGDLPVLVVGVARARGRPAVELPDDLPEGIEQRRSGRAALGRPLLVPPVRGIAGRVVDPPVVRAPVRAVERRGGGGGGCFVGRAGGSGET